jgi:hypothetical protein
MDVNNWGNPEEKEVDTTTIAQLDELCNTYAEQRKATELIKAQLSMANAKETELETKIIAVLSDFGKQSWKTEVGNFIISNRFSVKTPKTPEEKAQFFDYLREKGIFEDMVNINSQTLQGFYRAEMDAALDRGEVNFRMPGIGEHSYVQTLSMRKGK